MSEDPYRRNAAASQRHNPPGPIAFQALARADLSLLHGWLLAPHVRAWWRGKAPTRQDIEQKYGPQVDTTDPTRNFIFRLEDTPVGMIQCYRHADYPDWDRTIGIHAAAGIDYLIGEPDRCGQGVGSAAIAAFTTVVFDLYLDIAVIVSAPQKDNRASCRALEKTGFSLLHERALDSDDPSDAGISAVYALPRPQ